MTFPTLMTRTHFSPEEQRLSSVLRYWAETLAKG